MSESNVKKEEDEPINQSQIHELYSDILYALDYKHNPNDVKTSNVVAHLQNVFHIDNQKHAELLPKHTMKKKDARLVLNLEVVSAKGLKGKNANGLSNPTCLIYISPHQKQTTGVKSGTLNPRWEECFSLPVANFEEDFLHIDVCNTCDPDEKFKEKVKKTGKVKSKASKGFKKLVKEVTLASTGKRKSHSVLGCFKLPLKDIPSGGIDNWFPLTSKNPSSHKIKGQVHLRLGIGTEKSKDMVIQEYQQVFHSMLLHELDHEQSIEAHKWDGGIQNNLSELILQTLQLKSGLSRKDVDLARWLVYTKIHCEQHPLNVNIFPTMLQIMFEYLSSQSFRDDELQRFWLSAEKLLENFVAFLRNNSLHQLYFLFSTPQLHHMLKTPQLLKSFLMANPSVGNQYNSNLTVDFIVQRTENAISDRAIEFFNGIAHFNSEEPQLEQVVKVAELLITDLGKNFKLHQKDFKDLLGVGHFDITYLIYDKKYFEILKPIVTEVRKSLQLLNLIYETDYDCCQEEYVKMGTTLFKLYLLLKQFAEFSTTVKASSSTELCIPGTFHNWFHNKIPVQWLDIARFKAMDCIKKAVHVDDFQPIDDLHKITSSAVDTVGILQRIEIWNQLSSSEISGSCSFVPKILDDLGSCAIYYANLMCKRSYEIASFSDGNYYVSDQLCYAINNIERVTQQMKPDTGNNGIESQSVLEKLVAHHQPCVRVPCKRTLMAVMENAAENIKNKTIGILAEIGLKTRPTVQKLLLEAAETKSESGDVEEKLVKYLDKNLFKLGQLLSQEIFEKVFSIIWENFLVTLRHVIETNIEKKKPPDFFKRIQKIFPVYINLFYPESSSELSLQKIQEIENLLVVHVATTQELILMYCQERHEIQSKMGKTSPLGFLTVRAYYCGVTQILWIQILNARHLKPRVSNRERDSYVKVHLLTKTLLLTGASFKTKVKKKTLFPLFDESFSIPLRINPDELSNIKNGVIMFIMKDYGRFGTIEFIGDCFLPLDSIPITTPEAKFENLPQRMLPLSLPNVQLKSMAYQTLETRQWNRAVTEFMNRFGSCSINSEFYAKLMQENYSIIGVFPIYHTNEKRELITDNMSDFGIKSSYFPNNVELMENAGKIRSENNLPEN